MKSRWRTSALIAALILIAIQFYPAARNLGSADGPHDIRTRLVVPDGVHTVLVQACYKCHSNHTDYPWYAGVQPIGWWLARHITEGKRDLNFSEFGTYNPRRMARKLDAIGDEVAHNRMPLRSYTWLHPEARLTAEQRKIITDWTEALHDRIMPE